MTDLLVRHPPGYAAERRYAYRVMLEEFLGLSVTTLEEDRADVEISVPSDGPAVSAADDTAGASLRVADVLFATPPAQWLTAAALPQLPLPRVRLDLDAGVMPGSPASTLPVLFGSTEPPPADDLDHLGIDVFGGAFFLLTRYEEFVSPARDAHDRFEGAGSIADAERLFDRPLVNEYLELLWSRLTRLWPGLRRRPWRMTLRLSHDVDFPLARVPMTEARRLARIDLRRETAPIVAARRLLGAALPHTPPRVDLYNTFAYLMRTSEALGLASAFYFIAGNTAGAIDGDYRLEEPVLRRLLRTISDRGHEIGLQPSYGTYLDPEQLRREFDRLRENCTAAGVRQQTFGGRQHYLRWANPTTWQSWEDAGLVYDSTLAFADRAGFRTGCCYEYPVFNLRTRRELALRERPLIVMEASLLEYQQLTLEQAAVEIERLSGIVRRFQGEMTLLWHNNRLLSRRARRAYERAARSAVSAPEPS